jgi:hypothetical protein
MLWELFPCAQRSKNGEMVDSTAIDAKNKDASCLPEASLRSADRKCLVIDGKQRLSNLHIHFRSIRVALLFLCRIAHIFLVAGF